MSINPTCLVNLQKYFTLAGTNSATSPIFGNDLSKPKDSTDVIINQCLLREKTPNMFNTVSSYINRFNKQVFKQMLRTSGKEKDDGVLNDKMRNYFEALTFLCLIQSDPNINGICQQFSSEFGNDLLPTYTDKISVYKKEIQEILRQYFGCFTPLNSIFNLGSEEKINYQVCNKECIENSSGTAQPTVNYIQQYKLRSGTVPKEFKNIGIGSVYQNFENINSTAGIVNSPNNRTGDSEAQFNVNNFLNSPTPQRPRLVTGNPNDQFIKVIIERDRSDSEEVFVIIYDNGRNNLYQTYLEGNRMLVLFSYRTTKFNGAHDDRFPMYFVQVDVDIDSLEKIDLSTVCPIPCYILKLSETGFNYQGDTTYGTNVIYSKVDAIYKSNFDVVYRNVNPIENKCLNPITDPPTSVGEDCTESQIFFKFEAVPDKFSELVNINTLIFNMRNSEYITRRNTRPTQLYRARESDDDIRGTIRLENNDFDPNINTSFRYVLTYARVAIKGTPKPFIDQPDKLYFYEYINPSGTPIKLFGADNVDDYLHRATFISGSQDPESNTDIVPEPCLTISGTPSSFPENLNIVYCNFFNASMNFNNSEITYIPSIIVFKNEVELSNFVPNTEIEIQVTGANLNLRFLIVSVHDYILQRSNDEGATNNDSIGYVIFLSLLGVPAENQQSTLENFKNTFVSPNTIFIKQVGNTTQSEIVRCTIPVCSINDITINNFSSTTNVNIDEACGDKCKNGECICVISNVKVEELLRVNIQQTCKAESRYYNTENGKSENVSLGSVVPYGKTETQQESRKRSIEIGVGVGIAAIFIILIVGVILFLVITKNHNKK